MDIEKIAATLKQVAADREWDQFHTPKNLAIALSVEASELLEEFQWLTEGEVSRLQSSPEPEKLTAIKDELADILYYLIRLSSVLNIDLEQAFWQKLEKSLAKYPVEKAKGKATKYDRL